MIDIRENHLGAFAAQLKGDSGNALTGCSENGSSDRGRSGEGNLGDFGMLDQCCATLDAVTSEDIEHARRQMLIADPTQMQDRERRFFGNFQHQGIAGHQGRGDLERRQNQRRVPGNDRTHNAIGLAARVVERFRIEISGFTLEFTGESGHIPENVDRAGRFCATLGSKCITVFSADGPSHRLDVLFERICDSMQQFASLAGRHARPGPEGFPGRRDRD